jgi:hypothetical protein
MPSYRFELMERLGLLAAAALDVLDEEFTEGQLDDDSHPPRTDLYNLADAVVTFVGERRLGDKPVRGYARDAIVDELLNELVDGIDGGGHVGALWGRLEPKAAA